MSDCPFCRIAYGLEDAEIVRRWTGFMAIVPLNPVVPGHVIVLPWRHVPDAAAEPSLTGRVMSCAARLAWERGGPCNIITSIGTEATQTVSHLHVHIIPRREGDGLKLPWSDQVAGSAAPTQEDYPDGGLAGSAAPTGDDDE